MNELMKMVGEGIRHFRKQQGLSQEELAHLAQIHESYVGKLERAEKACSVEVLAKVAGAFNVSLSDFFRYIQPEGAESRSSTLGQIVNRLRDRTEDEHRKILKLVDVVLDDKGK